MQVGAEIAPFTSVENKRTPHRLLFLPTEDKTVTQNDSMSQLQLQFSTTDFNFLERNGTYKYKRVAIAFHRSEIRG